MQVCVHRYRQFDLSSTDRDQAARFIRDTMSEGNEVISLTFDDVELAGWCAACDGPAFEDEDYRMSDEGDALLCERCAKGIAD